MKLSLSRFGGYSLILLLALSSVNAYADEASFAESFKDSAKLRDWEFKLLFQEGRSLHRTHKIDRAKKNYEKAYALDSMRIEVLPHLGLVNLELGNCAEALEYFEKYLSYEPDESLVGFNKAVCLLKLGKYQDALDELLKWKSSFKDSCQYYTALGCAYLKNNDPESALESLNLALNLNSENVSANIWHAEALRQNGRLYEAAEALKKICLLKEDDSSLLNNLAVLESDLQQNEEAEKNFLKASSLKCSRADINAAVLKVFALKEADILELAELSDRYQNNLVGDFLYGISLYRSGRAEESAKIFNEVLQKCENFKSDVFMHDSGIALTDKDIAALKEACRTYSGLAYIKLNDKEALKIWEELCCIHPNQPEYHYNFALALKNEKEYSQALSEIEAARRLVHILISESDADAAEGMRCKYEYVYYEAARLQEFCGQKQKAYASYTEWLKYFADNEKAEAVKSHIKNMLKK